MGIFSLTIGLGLQTQLMDQLRLINHHYDSRQPQPVHQHLLNLAWLGLRLRFSIPRENMELCNVSENISTT